MKPAGSRFFLEKLNDWSSFIHPVPLSSTNLSFCMAFGLQSPSPTVVFHAGMCLYFLCIKFSYLCLRQRINRLKLHKNIRDAGSFVVCIWCYKVLSNCYSCKRFMFTLCFGPADSHWVAALERTNCCHFWIQVWSFRTPAVLCHWNCSSSDFLSPFCTTVSTARSSSSCFTILP